MNEVCAPKEWPGVPRYDCFLELFPAMQARASNIALLSPGKQPLTYDSLCRRIEAIKSFLNDHGLGRNDRIGVTMPDGIDMAIVFLGVISGATFVPFRRHSTSEEIEFLMQRIGIKALIADPGTGSSAISVAEKNAIPVIEAKPLDESANILELSWKQGSGSRMLTDGFAEPEDIATVLTTTGTTSKPKIVPLTQANIFASTYHNINALRLCPADRNLHVLPMDHIAGLVISVIAPMHSGGSVVCTQGFNLEEFPRWLEEYRPTWYSAVPTMHQAVIELVERKDLNPSACSLRFVRTIASRLDDSHIERIEGAFEIPVIQAYGMTEALAITCTPLYPYKRKSGSVGTTLCPEFRIMAGDGSMLSPEQTGEIVVRGSHVFHGYENIPEANRDAFKNGWFRTGDIGHIDDEGFLYLTGRLKEVINRGGEKIAPQEVEAVLLEHPAVQDACVFRVLHSRLGEGPVAAVTLKNDCSAEEGELRRYVATKLAYYKVPNQILFVDSIPRNEMGKVCRDDMSRCFGHLLEKEFVAPVTETEKALARIWSEVLGYLLIGRDDDFFALGGDSLLAARVITRIRSQLGLELPILSIFENIRLRELAAYIDTPSMEGDEDQELAALIEEAERLSDEEARAELDREDIED